MSTTTNNTPSLTTRAALSVGDRLHDKTVVLSVDRDSGTMVCLHPDIMKSIGGIKARAEIAAALNARTACGHNDWRNITDAEGIILAREWAKIAPAQHRHLHAILFWAADTAKNDRLARVMWSGYKPERDGVRFMPEYHRFHWTGLLENGGQRRLLVPCVRTAPIPTP